MARRGKSLKGDAEPERDPRQLQDVEGHLSAEATPHGVWRQLKRYRQVSGCLLVTGEFGPHFPCDSLDLDPSGICMSHHAENDA